jgi:hypothetical protein
MEKSPIKDELLSMDLRLSEMEDKLDKLDIKLTQVVDAILGNPLTKQGGLIEEMNILKVKILELEKKQARYESFKNKVSWTVGLIMGGGMLLQYAAMIYSNLKK